MERRLSLLLLRLLWLLLERSGIGMNTFENTSVLLIRVMTMDRMMAMLFRNE
jgi:hypothetical protein